MGGRGSKNKNTDPVKPNSPTVNKKSSKSALNTSSTGSTNKTNTTPTKSEPSKPASGPSSTKDPKSTKPTATDQTSSSNTSALETSVSKETEDVGDELIREMNKKVGKEDFDLVVVLGIGSFGKVMKVKSKIDGKFYAMKVLNKAHLIDRNQVAHTRDERSILQKLQQPFIVKLNYAFQTKDKLYMIMDYVHGGELFYHLKNEGRFSEERVRFYAAEISSALMHLHSQNIIYRDLKPENLLLDSDGHIVITDFGLSKVVAADERTATFCGTPEYLAPEVLKNEGHGYKVDWWSLGTLIYEMLSGLPPFYSKNIHEMYQRILTSRLVFPNNFSPEAKSLLTGLLNRDPNERFSGEQVKTHPFFAKIDWEKLERKEIAAPWKPPTTMNVDAELLSIEVTDSITNGNRNLAAIEDKDADAFSGFTYVGPSGGADQAKSALIEEKKPEETKPEETKPEVDNKPEAAKVNDIDETKAKEDNVQIVDVAVEVKRFTTEDTDEDSESEDEDSTDDSNSNTRPVEIEEDRPAKE